MDKYKGNGTGVLDRITKLNGSYKDPDVLDDIKIGRMWGAGVHVIRIEKERVTK